MQLLCFLSSSAKVSIIYEYRIQEKIEIVHYYISVCSEIFVANPGKVSAGEAYSHSFQFITENITFLKVKHYNILQNTVPLIT